MDPGGSGHALVGFDIAVDPLTGGVLLLDANESTGRIDIVPE